MKPGRTKPRPQDVAQFDNLTIHQIGLWLAAAKVAYQRKQRQHKERKHDPVDPAEPEGNRARPVGHRVEQAAPERA